tara:strand:+ start:10975 stop:12090 length:1116 start_codon:yes stop_codon:yes gene_type:complete
LKENKKIVFVAGSADTLYRFRLELIKEILNRDYEVHVFISEGRKEYIEHLHKLKLKIHYFPFKRKSLGLLNSFQSVLYLVRSFLKIRPNVVFSYTHKSVVVGSISAALTFNKSISLITGTGHIFEDENLKKKFVKFLGLFSFKVALLFNKKVFFQNSDDLELFKKLKLVSFKKAVLVNGSGVDMDKFNDKSLPEDPIFLCMSRLIKSKGLIEYARAAKITKEKYPQSRFLLAGFPDQHHDSISENEIMNDWQSKYGIEYIGYAKYPEETLKKCSIYVLLSYNEGTPRSVLEAMSMGRPIITTNTSGCRQTVEDGHNGFLAEVKDVHSAANAMMKLMNDELRSKMGLNSFNKCKLNYNVHEVNKVYLKHLIC